MKKLRNEARGRDCQVRIPGICNFNSDTVVLAHLGGAGMGLKRNDMLGAWACHDCHAQLDGQSKAQYTKDKLELMHLQGMVRTLEVLISEDWELKQ